MVGRIGSDREPGGSQPAQPLARRVIIQIVAVDREFLDVDWFVVVIVEDHGRPWQAAPYDLERSADERRLGWTRAPPPPACVTMTSATSSIP